MYINTPRGMCILYGAVVSHEIFRFELLAVWYAIRLLCLLKGIKEERCKEHYGGGGGLRVRGYRAKI